MIEGVAMRPDEPLFVERMAHDRARNAALETDVKSYDRQFSTSKIRIMEEMIAAFASKMAHVLRNGDPWFRAAYMHLFVSRVELSADAIRIFGTKDAFKQALTQDGNRKMGRAHLLPAVVRSRRLELPRPFGHNDLNVARLPIPPRPHINRETGGAGALVGGGP